ncbi:MAG TPA: oligoendopeptidase F, partial [Symbiobacteriaceae bacterium]|nr:oligoendopeptidase F [Symbiobacteriaceae bacterium]
MQRPKRSAVPVDQTWNLDDLFASHEAWEAELDAIARDVATVAQYRGKLAEGPAVIAACLDAQEALTRRIHRAFAYANFRLSADSTDPANQADSTRAGAVASQAGAAMTFIKSEVLALPDGTVEGWIATDAALAAHGHLLRNWLETKPYMLLPQTEAALASLAEVLDSPHKVYNLSKGADMKFAPALDRDGQSHAVYEGGPQLSPDPVLRRNAYKSFTEGLNAYRNTYAATFATEVQKNVALAKLRGYQSAEAMLLHPHKVTLEVYNNILDIIGAELAPHMRRYQRLRQRLMGLEQMLYCDLAAPLKPEDEPVVTYAEAQEWILGACHVLGEEYHAIIRRAFAERWIDRSDNEGKRSGAFCNTVQGVHSYVFMTWADRVRPVFTLAHELGHAGHLTLAGRYQRLNNVRPPMSFIESPSTMNELLLAQYLLKQSQDEKVRRSVIVGLMGTYHHNFVNHLLEGELQRRIYKLAEAGKPVTEKVLTGTKGAILTEFWGDAVAIDEGARLAWMRQPHYYMGLYPYTYALGLTVSTAAAQAIAEEGQPAVDRWLSVLKAGGSQKPVELMKMAGVDMTTPAPIRKAVAYVGSL